MPALRIPLRVVFYREDGDWIAHCLEFDLAGDGSTKEAALQSLSTSMQIQVDRSLNAGNPANLFTPADGEYFRMFAAGRDVAIGELHLDASPVEVQYTEYREYSAPSEESSNEELITA